MNSVFILQDYMFFIQNFGCTDEHMHETSHLTISLDGMMHCKIDEQIVDCYGYILNAQVKHSRFGENADSNKIIFIFDPASPVFLRFQKQVLFGKKAVFINEEQYKMIKQLMTCVFKEKAAYGEWQSYVEGGKDNINKAIKELLWICGADENQTIYLDQRIEELITLIKQEEVAENTILELFCKEKHISKSRLLHLFKEELGISFKKYMQYQKFFKTWRYLAQGENITTACIHAGYSDSAHYSKFMKQCFGMATKQELTSIDGIYYIDE